MNILFNDTPPRGVFYYHLAKRLMEEGHQVFWVAFAEYAVKELREILPEDHILLLNKRYLKETHPKVGDYKLNEIIYGDRSLKYHMEYAEDYLRNIQQPIYDFLKTNQISLVIGEVTTSVQILMHRMVSDKTELGCIYLQPHTVRYPFGRFAFFKDEFQSEILKIDESKKRYPENDYEIPLKKPSYLKSNDKKLKKSKGFSARFERLLRFVGIKRRGGKDNPLYIYRFFKLFFLRLREEITKDTFFLLKRTPESFLEGKKFIFVPLHKQPESSIDVIGRYYEDQFLNIVNLWRILPEDWYIAVKEHTNAIGDRRLRFFRGLKKFPRVLVINEKADSYELTKNSELVVTVSGTAAYEAALMGKKALCFGPTFFSSLKNCARVTIEDFRNSKNIEDLVKRLLEGDAQKMDADEFSVDLINNSFPGITSFPYANNYTFIRYDVQPDMEKIEETLSGFLKLIRHLEKR